MDLTPEGKTERVNEYRFLEKNGEGQKKQKKFGQ